MEKKWKAILLSSLVFSSAILLAVVLFNFDSYIIKIYPKALDARPKIIIIHSPQRIAGIVLFGCLMLTMIVLISCVMVHSEDRMRIFDLKLKKDEEK